MNFTLSITVADVMAPGKSELVYHLSNQLNIFFRNRDYGPDVLSMEIGLLMTLTRKGYEHWYQPRRLNYVPYRQVTDKQTGELTEIIKTLRYEIKLDDADITLYTSATDVVSMRVLAAQLLRSLTVFENLPKAVKEFDVLMFKEDMHKALANVQVDKGLA